MPIPVNTYNMYGASVPVRYAYRYSTVGGTSYSTGRLFTVRQHSALPQYFEDYLCGDIIQPCIPPGYQYRYQQTPAKTSCTVLLYLAKHRFCTVSSRVCKNYTYMYFLNFDHLV